MGLNRVAGAMIDYNDAGSAAEGLTPAKIDGSNMVSSGRSASTVPNTASIFNIGDNAVRTNDSLIVTGPSGARTTLNSAAAINMIDPGSGTFSGQGNSGAALVLNGSKPGYYSNTSPGEFDVLQISGRQGYGDMDAITVSIVGVNGAMNAFESATQTVAFGNPSSVIKQMGVHIGTIATGGVGEQGMAILAAVGNIGQGVTVGEFAGASTTAPFQFGTPTNPSAWSVNGSGSAYTPGTMMGPYGLFTMGQTAYTPTLIASTGTLGSYTLNRCWVAQFGNLIFGGVEATLNSVGSASGVLGITLPVSPAGGSRPAGAGGGREGAVTGATLVGVVGSNLTIYPEGGANIIVNGANIIINFFYAAS